MLLSMAMDLSSGGAEAVPRRPSLLGGVVAAALVLGWRILDCPPERIWRDWSALLALFVLFSAALRGPRVARAFPPIMIFALAAVYLSGQMLHVLAAWDLLP
jgi:hypothetical protein